MGERNNEAASSGGDGLEDLFDPIMAAELGDDMLDGLEVSSPANDKARLAAKRRRAERRLEAMRLREELGDDDFDFDDDF